MALQSMTALKSMSIEKLVKLKSDVEAMLDQKVSDERHSLQQELTKLGGYTGTQESKERYSGRGRSQVSRSRNRSDLGRTRTETPLAHGGNQIRKIT